MINKENKMFEENKMLSGVALFYLIFSVKLPNVWNDQFD